MQDAFSVPSCPANLPNVSRGRRLPCLDVHPARNRTPGASGSIRPRRPSIERRGASVPTRVHLPTQLRHTRVSRHCALAPRRRHPRAMAPRLHRISTGCLVSQSVGMAPDHAATGRLPHGRYDSASTKAAPEKSSYHPCRGCAPGRFSGPSLPDSPPPGDMPRKALSAASGHRPVVTGAAPQTSRPTNIATARIIVSLAQVIAISGSLGSPIAGRPGRSRRPSATPASRSRDHPWASPRFGRGPPIRRVSHTRNRPPPRAARSLSGSDANSAATPPSAASPMYWRRLDDRPRSEAGLGSKATEADMLRSI